MSVIAKSDLFAARDVVKVLAHVQLQRGLTCWPWSKRGQLVIFAGECTWRIRTFLRHVFAVEPHQITPCPNDRCVSPYHTLDAAAA